MAENCNYGNSDIMGRHLYFLFALLRTAPDTMCRRASVLLEYLRVKCSLAALMSCCVLLQWPVISWKHRSGGVSPAGRSGSDEALK